MPHVIVKLWPGKSERQKTRLTEVIVKGVTDVKPGYSGGKRKNPSYEQVSDGDTGHAESVKITYDPSKVTYTQLLTIFFSVHDPTEKNRQGPDTGTQYRTAIFYLNDDQKKIATDRHR